jgi:hypothetical protein
LKALAGKAGDVIFRFFSHLIMLLPLLSVSCTMLVTTLMLPTPCLAYF